jgi:hypothetical protein
MKNTLHQIISIDRNYSIQSCWKYMWLFVVINNTILADMTRDSHNAKYSNVNMTNPSKYHMTMHSHISKVSKGGPNWDSITCWEWFFGNKNGPIWPEGAPVKLFALISPISLQRVLVIYVFFDHAQSYLPSLLQMLDGHNSHISLNVVYKAKNIGLDLLILPSHTSHTSQPLDICVF